MDRAHNREILSDTSVYLTFRLGENVFGLALQQVEEIVNWGSISPVPLTPRWLRGVFNLRGRVLPAVDLGVRLGFPMRDPSSRTCILMLDMQVGGVNFSTGIIVDEVKDIIDLNASQIEPPPTFGAGIKAEFISGIYHNGDQALLLLDVVRVFQADELLEIALTEQRQRAETDARVAANARAEKPRALPVREVPDFVPVENGTSSDVAGVHLFDEE